MICAVRKASRLSSCPLIPTRNPGSGNNTVGSVKASGACSVSRHPIPGPAVGRAESQELQHLSHIRRRLPGGRGRKCRLLVPPAPLRPTFPPLTAPDQGLDTWLHLPACCPGGQGWSRNSPRWQAQWHGHCLPWTRAWGL